jgi:hypothetical protein
MKTLSEGGKNLQKHIYFLNIYMFIWVSGVSLIVHCDDIVTVLG